MAGVWKNAFMITVRPHISQKYGELPCIRAKQINRGIPMFVEDGKLRFKLRKMQIRDSSQRQVSV